MSDTQLPEILEEHEPATEPKPSRVAGFLRTALRWSAAALVTFTLGIFVALYVRVRPLEAEAQTLQAKVEQLSTDLDQAQAELNRLRPLEADFEAAELRLDLLRILLDVTSARLALAEEDALIARFAISETEEALTSLHAKLSGSQASDLEAIQNRLQLVLSELEDDLFAARSDLEVIANWVVALERDLFEE
jgi:outer membrane murein-binding lipoprotein Lpp